MEKRMKKITISLILFLGIATHSYAEFYIVAVPTEVEVIKEVCTGMSVGEEAFKLVNTGTLYYGSVHATNSGKLVQITGITGHTWSCAQGRSACSISYSSDISFFVTPDALPESLYGEKGTFYYLHGSDMAYAKYL
jgi:hypothetical protein